MIYDNVENLLNRPVTFLDESAPDSQIAISTRIRLARNLADHLFPSLATDDECTAVCDTITAAAKKTTALSKRNAMCFTSSELDDIDRSILLERRLASPEFFTAVPGRRILVCPQEACSLMINEEDQLRLQILRPGLQLRKTWQEINLLDDQLGKELDFAFDDQFGFLTSCPTNVGTGLRASVMLHLPALVLTGQMEATLKGLAKLRIEVRGVYGELSDKSGNLFQISNQVTLGESESRIIDSLETIIRQIIDSELRTRKKLLQSDHNALLDQIGRAYGRLRYCYTLTEKEALDSLSGLRLGVALGLFKDVNIAMINEMFTGIMNGHLQKRYGKKLTTAECDIFRAVFCREKLRRSE